jgi:hypothetical protein
MAVRLATIRAIGIDPHDPRVTEEDMNWGAALALQSADAMIEGARDRISETVRGKWVNRIIGIIKKKGTCKVKDIQNAIRSEIRSAEIKEIIADLVESGRVEAIDVTDKRSDTKKVVAYRLIPV